MDVTSDRDLFDFIESLGKEEEEEKKYSTTTFATAAATTATANNTTNRIDTAISDSDSTATASLIISDQDLTESAVDVWQDIADALNNWSERILSIESQYTNQITNFRKTIEESLVRQQLDGFLNHQDVSEIRYTSSLWINLLQAISCYTVGCISVKRDILSYLLELHTLGQINKSLFIETCLQL